MEVALGSLGLWCLIAGYIVVALIRVLLRRM